MLEVWKDIKGFEGRYQISNKAEVKSLERQYFAKSKIVPMTIPEIILKSRTDKDGYLIVNLKKENKSHIRKIHRLVAENFIENKNNLPTVNHKNGIKTDNRIENLEWLSYADNNRHRTVNLLAKPKLNADAIKDIAKNCVAGVNHIENKNSISAFARKYNVTRGTIYDILSGKKLYLEKMLKTTDINKDICK